MRRRVQSEIDAGLQRQPIMLTVPSPSQSVLENRRLGLCKRECNRKEIGNRRLMLEYVMHRRVQWKIVRVPGNFKNTTCTIRV